MSPSVTPSLFRDYRDAGVQHVAATFRAALADRIEEALPRVEVPTLVMRGEHDRMVPHAWAEEVTQLLPRGRLATWPGAAHMLPYSHPAGLAGAIEQFVEQA